MASTYEPTFSSSINRQAIDSSVADTLPNINFGFDELRDRMAKFTSRFDAFIEQGRKRVLEERNQFRVSIAELQGTSEYLSPRKGERRLGYRKETTKKNKTL